MDKIAFFIGSSTPVYWHTILIVLGTASCVLMMTALCLLHGRKTAPLLLAVPLSIVLSLFFGRLIHWYCFPEEYTTFWAAITEIGSGSFTLTGAFPGTFLTFALLRILHIENDLPGSLDDLSIAGSLGIAAGRLGEFFGSADRGKFLFEEQSLHHLPLSAVVLNKVSGGEEWRFATFCFQSIWAAAIFFILTFRMIILDRRPPKLYKKTSGRGMLLFLVLYCAGQIMLDSTRYDAMFLRSNGFVSLEQIACCVIITAILAGLSVRGIRSGGFKAGYILCWLLYTAGFTLAGYMEYYVQRHGDMYVVSYNTMAAGLLAMIASIILISISGTKNKNNEGQFKNDSGKKEEE